MRLCKPSQLLRGDVAGLDHRSIFNLANVFLADYPLRPSSSSGILRSLKVAVEQLDIQGSTLEPDKTIRKVFRSVDDFVWNHYNEVDELHMTLAVLIRLQGLSFREHHMSLINLKKPSSKTSTNLSKPDVPHSKGLSIFATHWTNSSQTEKERDWYELKQELLKRDPTLQNTAGMIMQKGSILKAVWNGAKKKAARTLLSKPPIHAPLFMTRPQRLDRTCSLEIIKSLLLTSKDVFGDNDELWQSALLAEMLRHFVRVAQDTAHTDTSVGSHPSPIELDLLLQTSKLVSGSAKLKALCPEEYLFMRTVTDGVN